MPLFAGVWYAEWPADGPCPCEADAQRGLVVLPSTLDKLCAGAAGAPVTWEHSAMDTISSAEPGSERTAALSHPRVVGTVKASWIHAATGHAHVVFEVLDTFPLVAALIQSKMLRSLSATHVVGRAEMIELSLTNSPARPGCDIFGRVSSVADYIALYPPLIERRS